MLLFCFVSTILFCFCLPFSLLCCQLIFLSVSSFFLPVFLRSPRSLPPPSAQLSCLFGGVHGNKASYLHCLNGQRREGWRFRGGVEWKGAGTCHIGEPFFWVIIANKLLLAVVVVEPIQRDIYVHIYLIVAGEIARQCDPLPFKMKNTQLIFFVASDTLREQIA